MLNRALITGAADSVGLESARALSRAGHQVFICDISEQKVERALAANPTLRGCVADVSHFQSVQTMYDGAVGALGGQIDILINAVGIGRPRALTEDVEFEDWTQVFKANVDSAFLTMQRAIPSMKERGSGVILNFSSASTKTRLPARTAYVATKYAVEGLTLNAARELGPYGVRCNALLPGPINNDRLAAVVDSAAQSAGCSPAEYKAQLLSYASTRKATEPGDIAALISFLVSDAACNITGQSICIDGNMEWEG